MGLRALAYYLDRTEAMVVQSALLDGGILAVVGNEDMLRAMPHLTLAFGGYRVLVSDLEIEEATALLTEARSQPGLEGEKLVVEGDLLDRVLSPIVGYLSGGAPAPLRRRRWVA
jgi:hypothetical protein